MIIEIILIIFAILYYWFSLFVFGIYVQDVKKRHAILQILGMLVIIMIISPLATPIILGIKLGYWIKNN